MHLTIILDRINTLLTALNRAKTALYKTEQKIQSGTLTQQQLTTLEEKYQIVSDCTAVMEGELAEMNDALTTIESINNSGLLG